MIRLAWKNLTAEPLRLAISAGGVALALVLILVMQGIFTGSEEHAVAYMKNQPAELWLMQDGVENLHMATSLIPPTALREAEETEGVAEAVGVLYANVGVDLGDSTVFSYVFGVEPGAPFGGPWSITEGQSPKAPGEIVLDRVLAARHGIGLGDKVSILDSEFEISGLAEGNFGIATSLVFVHKADLAQMLGVPKQVSSYMLIQPEAGTDLALLKDDLARIDGVNLMDRQQFIESDQEMISAMGADVIKAMNSVAFVVGMLVIGLTLYSATLERKREYGILRAIGGTVRHLWTVILAQAFISALLGVMAGVGLAYASARLISSILPEMLVLLDSADVLQAVLVLLAVSLIASWLPALQIGRLNPMIVFRE